jgi:prolyl-tRNA synthetase
MAADAVYFGRRDKGHKDKVSMNKERFINEVGEILDDIQKNLFERALMFRKKYTAVIDDAGAFNEYFTPANKDKPEIHGGFALAHWCGSDKCESKVKDELGVTIRSIPFEGELEMESANGRCICCDKPSDTRVVFAKAY